MVWLKSELSENRADRFLCFHIQSIDQMCAMLSWSLRQSDQGHHPSIVGRTFDLKAAYKQFGLSEFDRKLLRIAVRDPSRKDPVLLGVNALPFGGVGSVAGFLRISLATWFTGVAGLKLCWTGYFDDFSSICRPELQMSTTWAVDSLFTLIGLDYAKDGPKAPAFSQVFKMLGVQVDTSNASQGSFAVGHTAERRDEPVATLEAALAERRMSQKLAESVRGRMVFYECFSAGRTTNLLLKEFGRLCKSDRQKDELSESDCAIVHALIERVATAKPVDVGTSFMDTWYIFTDGACEDGELGIKSGGVGGVLISPCGRYLQHFGGEVPKEWMDHLLRYSKHPIHELEILPVFISFYLWKSFISNAQVVHYTDNDSCRFALMKGVGETPVAKRFVKSILDLEHQSQSRSWYGRVPSHSNPSDDPSRGSHEALVAVGSLRAEIPWGEMSRFLLSSLPY